MPEYHPNIKYQGKLTGFRTYQASLPDSSLNTAG